MNVLSDVGSSPGQGARESKEARENHPDVMSTQHEARYEDENFPKERENLKRPVPHEEIIKVPFVKEEPKKTFNIGTIEYKDIFAWGPEDMSGLDTSVAL
ncbi:hypothetical protein LIER_24264 [Lithospermum erythrorhizon]|uniref:Uncharacterized protein n=1 Tax=Lithospermum erythrorhizon TaxID=34254 RepID=A0AAV3R0F0_LITER